MKTKVLKRDRRLASFDTDRIAQAIVAAMKEVKHVDEAFAEKTAENIARKFEDKAVSSVSVEKIQDMVEEALMASDFKDVARAYILYRDKRNKARSSSSDAIIASIINAEHNDITRENANSDANTPAGMMAKIASERSKEYAINYLLSDKTKKYYLGNLLHVHDLDYLSSRSTTCLQAPLNKLLANGFQAGHGESRPARRIETASILTAISLETTQNEQHGGQSIPAFDYYLAPYVRSTYKEEVKKIERITHIDLSELYNAPIEDYIKKDAEKGDYKQMAINETIARVHQSMEAFIHNMNTIHCVHGDELIIVHDLFDGRTKQITIRQLCDTFFAGRYEALSVNKANKVEWKQVTAAAYQGQKDTYKVKGKSGHQVIVTDNHRIATSNKKGVIEFKYPHECSNLVIPCLNTNPIFDLSYKWDLTKFHSRKAQNYTKSYIPMSIELCELLGLWVADGCMIGEGQMAFSMCDEELTNRATYLMQKVYGEDVTYYITCYSKPKKVHQIRFNVGKVWGLNVMDVCGKSAKYKQVPYFILNGTKEMQRAFLRGYLLCDGSIKFGGGHYNASSISEKLINGIDYMYQQLGELTYRHSRFMRNYYDPSILGNKSFEISFSGKSEERLKLGFELQAELEYRKYNKEFTTREYFVEDIDEVSIFEKNADVYDIAIEDNENFITAQGVLIHNSRQGNQVVFSSINYGTDTSAEGRCVIRELLLTTERGVGNGSTAIFPIQIWKLKAGVSKNPGDRNYDLYQLACRVTARRFFPNFLNLDATFNKDELWREDDPKRYEHEVATMGCVDGDEVISYKFDDRIYVTSFEKFWNHMRKHFKVQDATEEFFEVGEFIDLIGVEIQDGDGFVECARIIKNPDKSDWMKITLSNGRVLMTTSDHPWSTINRGVVLSNQLTLGDRIEITSKQPIMRKNQLCNTEIAWLKGFVICDGCYDKQMMSTIGVDETDIAEKYCNIFKTKLRSQTFVKERNRGEKGDYLELKNYTYGEGKISKFATQLRLEFEGLKKIDRKIPNWVFSESSEVRASFLAGMMDADGYINSQRDRAKCQIGSTNKVLAIQTMLLAQSLGVPAKIYENHYCSSRPDAVRYRVEFDAFELLLKHMASKKKTSKSTMLFEPIDFKEGAVTKIEFIGNRNKSSYDVTTKSEHFTVSGIRSHNCRTRVYENRHGERRSVARGNLSFSTINLPGLALSVRNIENEDIRIKAFFEKLKELVNATADQLYDRYKFQCEAKAKQFPLLMSGMWKNSENLKPEDKVEPVLKHGTLGVGFIGLAECLIALIGKHHGESKEAQELGLKIISYMKELVDKRANEVDLNYSVLATPAEGLSGKFTKKDKLKYGVVPGVTDKDYYTNSNHVPVYYKCSASHKAAIEGPYHELTRGGHIFYVELDGDATHNVEAIYDIVSLMDKNNIGYCSVNHNRNRCIDCGYEDAQEDLKECPNCGSKDIDTIQRITGYLVGGISKWNSGKLAELKDRVAHDR